MPPLGGRYPASFWVIMLVACMSGGLGERIGGDGWTPARGARAHARRVTRRRLALAHGGRRAHRGLHGRRGRGRPDRALARAAVRRSAHAHRRGGDRTRPRHGPGGGTPGPRWLYLRAAPDGDPLRPGERHHARPARGLARLRGRTQAYHASVSHRRPDARCRPRRGSGQPGGELAARQSELTRRAAQPEHGGRGRARPHRPVRVHGHRGCRHRGAGERVRPRRRDRHARRGGSHAARRFGADPRFRTDLP